ncbi:MAG: radical SAM protein [Chloroflexota bacterium]
MKYVFGPVPSRRLGRSLGIDPIPLKTCNWNCIYCQLGRSVPLTDERREYFPRAEILAEVKQHLATHPRGEIDWVTFVGSGEPTLHSGLGWLIHQVKTLTDIPVAVITNGALLHRPAVYGGLLNADAVMPTLDAGNAELYRRINRPSARCPFDQFVEGLVAFRQKYRGKLWLEVMLVKDLNDSDEALREIAAVVRRIQPDQVHLNLPTRPPAEPWVQPSDGFGLMRASFILGDLARVVPPAEGAFNRGENDNIVDAVVSIITRHPMREEELIRTLKQWTAVSIEETLKALSASGRIQVVERYGARFYCAMTACYPG